MPHFEIHVNDVARAKAFYSGLFGWQIDPAPIGEEMEYHMITGPGFAASGETGLTGGMMRRFGDSPAPNTPVRGGTLTVEVADCDDRYAWALANGGAPAMPPEEMPGIGRFAYVEDGEGNIVGMISDIEGDDA